MFFLAYIYLTKWKSIDTTLKKDVGQVRPA